MITQIINGSIVKPDCTGYEQKDLWIRDGRIIHDPKETPDRIVDAQGAFLLPGLVDIHNHGSMGVSYQIPCEFDQALAYAAGQGITTVIATISTRPMDKMLEAIRNVRRHKEKKLPGAYIGGLHLEGPFISEGKKGAMLTPDIPCTMENFLKLLEEAGELMKIMTLAPERENAMDLIAEGAKRGIRMSIGHTQADYDTAMAAIRTGATGATHVFNAMNTYGHRDPGTLGAVLTEKAVTCETICDMVHLAPATVKLVRLAKGLEGMILISDSGLMTGLGDGDHLVDGVIRSVRNGVCRNRQGTIAGSAYSMADGARRLAELGFSLCDIARVGAWNPACAVGMEKEVGSLEAGKWADIVFCDQAFHVKKVLTRGVEVPLSPEAVYGGQCV